MQIKDRVKELKRVRASDLIPNPKNWRTHPATQQDALKGVLSEIGYADALLARETDKGLMLVDGHLRAETTPDSIVPVLVLDITEEESDLMLATLDPLAAMAGQDENRLTELLSTVTSKNNTVNALLQTLADGYEPLTIPDPEPKDEGFDVDDALDDAEADDYEPIVKRGEVWSLGDHRLMCGDSRIPENVDTLVDGNLADAMWTDPPYGVNYEGKTKEALTIQNDQPSDARSLLLDVFKNTPLRPSSPIYISCPAGPQGLIIQKAFVEAGFRFAQLLAWVKDRMVLGHSDYHYIHENIIYGYTEGGGRPGRGNHEGTRWHGGHSKVSVFNVPRRGRNAEHPTMKPIELVEQMIANSTDTKESIYDPFVGSGTTIIAAERLDRRCYAMEIEPRYCDVAIKRWEDYTGEKAIKSE